MAAAATRSNRGAHDTGMRRGAARNRQHQLPLVTSARTNVRRDERNALRAPAGERSRRRFAGSAAAQRRSSSAASCIGIHHDVAVDVRAIFGEDGRRAVDADRQSPSALVSATGLFAGRLARILAVHRRRVGGLAIRRAPHGHGFLVGARMDVERKQHVVHARCRPALYAAICLWNWRQYGQSTSVNTVTVCFGCSGANVIILFAGS